MKKIFAQALIALSLVGLMASQAAAASIPIGYYSWNETDPGVSGSFDIVNQTGVNSTASPDNTWPVAAQLALQNFSLLVQFTDLSVLQLFAPGDFTQNPDGISWDGPSISIARGVLPSFASLSGFFTPVLNVLLNDGSTVDFTGTYTASIGPNANGLSDGDFAIIYADTVTGTPQVPEPGTLLLLGTGVLGLVHVQRRRASRS